MTLRQLAQRLGVSYDTVYRAHKSGQLPYQTKQLKRRGLILVECEDVTPSRIDRIERKVDELLHWVKRCSTSTTKQGDRKWP